jgi:hypothetical protein
MVVAGDARFAWGQGPDQLVEAVGTFAVGRPEEFDLPIDSKQRVEVRGEAAVAIPIGDDGVGQVALTWQSGDCPYTVWLAPGHSLDAAIRYAAAF